MAVLEVCDLTKSYGGQQVLRGVSFSLEKGEVLSIIGSSGSGKTTLLRCLNFLETPQSGSIAVNGEVLFDAAQPEKPTPDSIRRKRLHFGLVFQSFNLFPQYTVLQNITLAPNLRAKESAKQRGQKAEPEAFQKMKKGRWRCWHAWVSPIKRQLPLSAFGRPAATCGHCTRPGAGAGCAVL